MAEAPSTGSYAAATSGSANIEIGPPWSRPGQELLDRFLGHSAANVGDALGRLGMPDGGIKPLWDGCHAAGSALTVLTPAGDDLAVIDAVGYIEPGDLVVINGFGYAGRAVMGGILAQYFVSRGAVGAVVDGAVRDREEIRGLGFPVWSRSVIPAGPWKNGPGAIGTPVAIGGVVVHPGDVVVADSDGIVAVPLARAQHVAAGLSRIAEFERGMQSEARQSPAGDT